MCPTVVDQTNTSLECSTIVQAQIVLWGGFSKFVYLTFLLSYINFALLTEHRAHTGNWRVMVTTKDMVPALEGLAMEQEKTKVIPMKICK